MRLRLASTPPPIPTAILIDWDHTLVNPCHTYTAAFEKVRAQLADEGYDIGKIHKLFSCEELAHNIHTRGEAREIMKLIYADAFNETIGQRAWDLCRQYVRELSPEHNIPERGAIGLMHFLEEKNIPYAVVSNKKQARLEDEFHTLFDRQYPHATLVGTAEHTPHDKPNPGKLFHAFEKLGISKADQAKAWMVGDRMDTDAEAARAAGCIPVLVGPQAMHSPEQAADVMYASSINQLYIHLHRAFTKEQSR